METKLRTYKLGKDIEVGDVVLFLGNPHRIARFLPYNGLVVGASSDCRIAKAVPNSSGYEWGITLEPNARVEVA